MTRGSHAPFAPRGATPPRDPRSPANGPPRPVPPPGFHPTPAQSTAGRNTAGPGETGTPRSNSLRASGGQDLQQATTRGEPRTL
ncbi:hypothetical protein F8144_44195 [Streptomyces triticiradicis]|uniref:Uncharacterized protein n=1 Tax=Streptomyces triticiradicis TaxID=2651189 RepID=A0A7J5D147_9ACTN|nr:hypothetical protein F8144_44195 [Streptomyces triticiradicis]